MKNDPKEKPELEPVRKPEVPVLPEVEPTWIPPDREPMPETEPLPEPDVSPEQDSE